MKLILPAMGQLQLAAAVLQFNFVLPEVARKVNYAAYLQSNYLFNQFALQSKTGIVK